MTRGDTSAMTRKTGVALWRQIADSIRQGIGSGAFGREDRLPPEMALAERYGVNRHTVRSAIAALVQEGVLRAEQGRGTFIEPRKRLAYPIARRTRFSEGLRDQTQERRGHLLDHAVETADDRVAAALGLSSGARVERLETMAEADGRPVSRATSWFDAARFAGFAKAFAETGSVTLAYRRYDIEDYFRKSTTVSARLADSGDLATLDLAPGAVVLVTVAVNVDAEDRPIQYSETRFAADRVELTIAE